MCTTKYYFQGSMFGGPIIYPFEYCKWVDNLSRNYGVRLDISVGRQADESQHFLGFLTSETSVPSDRIGDVALPCRQGSYCSRDSIQHAGWVTFRRFLCGKCNHTHVVHLHHVQYTTYVLWDVRAVKYAIRVLGVSISKHVFVRGLPSPD